MMRDLDGGAASGLLGLLARIIICRKRLMLDPVMR